MTFEADCNRRKTRRLETRQFGKAKPSPSGSTQAKFRPRFSTGADSRQVRCPKWKVMLEECLAQLVSEPAQYNA